MRRGTVPPRAVVADGRPLERSLVRFLLGEAGYVVVAEAGAAHDTAEAVREYRPDVVVLHENAAVEQGVPIITDLRRASPATKVILVTLSGTTASADLLEEADEVIEEGAGIKELGFALASTRQGIRTEKAGGQATLIRPLSSGPGVRNHLRWLERMQGAAAASILIIAIALFAGQYSDVPSGPDGNREPSVHLSAAFRSLDVLAQRVSTADAAEVGSLAARLIAQRAMALASGENVSALDEEIVTTLRPLIPSMSPEAGETLLYILGDLLPGTEPPTPTAGSTSTPEPSPQPDQTTAQGSPPERPGSSESPPPEPALGTTETPPPIPSETPPPIPSETPPPIPSETPPPIPSETPPPIPSETPPPIPSETPPPPEPTQSHTPPPRPTPSQTPSPSPSETPSPIPSETPSPTPSETLSPSPSETPSPTPSETLSPSPEPTQSETPSPSPEPTPSETPSPTTDSAPINPGVIVVPPGIVGLVAVSRSARRRRSQRGSPSVGYVPGEHSSSQMSAGDDLRTLHSYSPASQQNVDEAEELVRRLTTAREAIEVQSIRVAELEEQFRGELRRVQALRESSEPLPVVDNRDDGELPQGESR